MITDELRLIDWDLIQLQFEILHEPIENIAKANKIPVATVEYAVDESKWKRKPLNDLLATWKDADNIEQSLPNIVESLEQRIRLIQLLKIANFNARWTELEATAISKIRESLTYIDPGDSLGNPAAQIKTLVESMKELRVLSETSINDSTKENPVAGNTLNVMVQTKATANGEEAKVSRSTHLEVVPK